MTALLETAKLAAIAELANKQLRLEEEIAAIQDNLQYTQKKLDQIRREALPAAMEEAGLIEFTLETGQKITLSTIYTASLTGQYREPAVNWLVRNGMENIISRNFIQTFARGETKDSESWRRYLLSAGIPFIEREDVNTGTFKAIIREFLEDGKDVPLAELGVTALTATVITTPKKR